MTFYLRIYYPSDIDDRIKAAHWQKMNASYGDSVCEDDPHELCDGFCLQVDDVKSARVLALSDRFCSRFVISHINPDDPSASEEIVERGGIGEVSAFTHMYTNTDSYHYILNSRTFTHLVKFRHDENDYFVDGDFTDSVYTPAGRKIWPVHMAEIDRENTARNEAFKDAHPTMRLGLF